MTATEVRSEAHDRYPTRITGETHLLERVEPTVWSDEADGPMDAGDLAAHAARGYSIVDGLLSPAEVQAYWSELHRLYVDEGLRSDERLAFDPETGELTSIFAVHEISELFAELVRDPRVLDRARQVLGSEVYVHQSKVTLVPGFTDPGYFWRSEFERWHAEDGMAAPRAVSVSITLADAFASGGAMMLMPGSHRTFVSCGPDKNPPRTDITKLAAEYGIEQFTGQAGAALLADCNVLHGAGSNITPYPRSSIWLAFNSVENPLVEPFSAEARRPEHLASRQVDTIEY
ncbi:phytanoyl-CoA dioxygenase family protein [Sciscionella sediminilitoris]|uniref:phytanoyl-CoA dioxygenase family protein n=1 Tax=Sciscionella sediminilitoris TaxID=1445613 RepID=UPI0004DEFEBE|nr:phytanoyl-CoA dioxygenase family protein [Sciscionella sp. SE31]